MLATKPQSIKNIIVNGVKTYKKIFMTILPISAIWTVLYIAENGLQRIGKVWVDIVSFFLSLLVLLCFSWGLIFVYHLITKQTVNFNISLKLALRRFLRVFGLVLIMVLGTIITIIIVATIIIIFWVHILKFPQSDLTAIPMAVLLIPSFVSILCIGVIAIMEILIKQAKVFFAIKRAIKIFFRMENMWRAISVFMIVVLLSFILFVPTVGLVFWLTTHEVIPSGVMSIMLMMVLAFLIMTFVWFPLFLSIYIHLYNDLVLRFEKRHT